MESNKHQLHSEACPCEMCQRVNLQNTLQMRIYPERDHQSEFQDGAQDAYVPLLMEAHSWNKHPRKLRFLLPQVCVYNRGNPQCLISKTKESAPTKLVRNRARMNMFEIYNVLLEGYLQHSSRRDKGAVLESCRTECVAVGRYKEGVSTLLTLLQIENLFKSKYKHMREGLLYLQTLVGGKGFQQLRLKIDIDQYYGSPLLERAKTEVRMMLNEVKVIDKEYLPEKAEVEYQNSLKHNPQQCLTYLALKIILLSSKTHGRIIQSGLFKFVSTPSGNYLWDLRVFKMGASASYWQSSGVQAYEYNLSKTMSMMEMPREPVEGTVMESTRMGNLLSWLQDSTAEEFREMRIIRSRLDKLEAEKKALGEQLDHKSAFKIRASTKLSVSRSNPED